MKGKNHYAWVIVSVIFLAFLAVQGGRLAFGAFMEPWERDLSIDRGITSLISTVSFIIYGITQPIIGRLVDKFGARLILSVSTFLVGTCFFFISFVTDVWQLFILYSIVSIGVGGASNVVGTVLVVNWFNKKRGMALGILEAGFGFGQMLIVPGSLLLIHYFDWRVAILSLGLFLMVIVFPIVLLTIRNHPKDKGLFPIGGSATELELGSVSQKENNHKSIWVVFRMRKFWFLMLPFLICGFTTTGLMDTHLIPYSSHHGHSTAITSTAVSILAAFNIIGILLSGIIVDHWSSRKLLVLLYGTRALSMALLLYSQNSTLLIIFAIIFGLVDFATVAPTQLLATQYFKAYSIGFIVGCLSLAHQVGSALGAYVPGMVYTLYNSYDIALYVSVVILIGAAIMNVLLPEPKE
ncbi:MFS transporter [Paucisalibacillus globulus]|uniref:MFS transporter n=1 Tax=Paucisalibacillus globulus TaxID=351095 RepID=UPI000BB8C3FA|nr:MFS transporter [Paucisalibacillus globulus]